MGVRVLVSRVTTAWWVYDATQALKELEERRNATYADYSVNKRRKRRDDELFARIRMALETIRAKGGV